LPILILTTKRQVTFSLTEITISAKSFKIK
jgi:hypothetical protein